jgi:hypothetical protein
MVMNVRSLGDLVARNFWWAVPLLVIIVGASILLGPIIANSVDVTTPAGWVENKIITIQNPYNGSEMCLPLTDQVAHRVDIKNESGEPLEVIMVGIEHSKTVQVHPAGYVAHGNGYAMTEEANQGILVVAGDGCLKDLSKIYAIARAYMPSATSITRMDYSGIPRSRWIVQEP